MGSFKFGLFDVFVYTLPGLVYLFCILLIFHGVQPTVRDTALNYALHAKSIDANSVFLGFVISYILGFASHPFGFTYFNLIGKKIWRKHLIGKEMAISSLVKETILVRHHSQGNLTFVEICTALRAMSFNLSLAFLVLTILVLIIMCSCSLHTFDWIVLVLITFGLSMVTLNRAAAFHNWTVTMLQSTVEVLKLHEIKSHIPDKG